MKHQRPAQYKRMAVRVRWLRSGALGCLIALFTTAHAADLQPRALLEKAEAAQQLGHRNQALEYLEQARASAEQGSDAVLTASIHGALGKAYLLRGRSEEARTLLTRALESSQVNGTRELQAALLNDLGNLAIIDGKPAEAAQLYQRSQQTARSIKAHTQAATATANIARLRLQQPDNDAALGALEELERDIKQIAAPQPRLAALLAAGELLGRLYDVTRRRALLERTYLVEREALATALDLKDLRSISLARGALARLYYLEGRHADASDLADLALAAAQAGQAPDLLYRWHWLTAQIQVAQGKSADALGSYRRAVQRFQAVRVDLIQELNAAHASYRDAVGPLFIEYADLLLKRAKTSGAQADLAEAREVIEQFRSVELEDYFQDECVARLQARRKAIETVAADTAVIYPIFLNDRAEVLVSIGGRIKQVTLSVPSAALTAELHEFRYKLEKRTTNEYLPHAQRLYTWLFRPLESELNSAITTIVLIPDGALRSIPLGALHDGKEFLINRYAFAVAPGLSLLEPRPLSNKESRVLLSGVSEGVQMFSPLPGVLGELASIEQFTKGKTLRNSEFSASAFEKELRRLPYSVVHIASHGQFESDPKKSFLLTYDGKISMDDLEQYIKLTRFRDEPVELLTLSGCRTAAGDDRAALGLAGIAIKAGARSALATLWSVSDQASSDLIGHFYELIRTRDTSKVTALQLAQKRMLTDARYRHPSYWAPFLLIGNWL